MQVHGYSRWHAKWINGSAALAADLRRHVDFDLAWDAARAAGFDTSYLKDCFAPFSPFWSSVGLWRNLQGLGGWKLEDLDGLGPEDGL